MNSVYGPYVEVSPCRGRTWNAGVHMLTMFQNFHKRLYSLIILDNISRFFLTCVMLIN